LTAGGWQIASKRAPARFGQDENQIAMLAD